MCRYTHETAFIVLAIIIIINNIIISKGIFLRRIKEVAIFYETQNLTAFFHNSPVLVPILSQIC
jgi:hypothetical protein